ncbi:MAG: hypothetical protein WB019_09620, partial [Pseudolabrys sp.]
MASFRRIRRAIFAITTGAAIAIGLLLGPIVTGTLAPAQAQISEDAQIALEQYGSERRAGCDLPRASARLRLDPRRIRR